MKNKKNDKDKVIEQLTKLTKKKHILFFDKCRISAEFLMKFALKKNITNTILQEEGGWHTYEKSASSLNLKVIKAPMINGVIKKDNFPDKDNSLIIINSMPGYLFLEDMSFYEHNKKNKNNSFLVNDVSGSIGEPNSIIGDFIIGSFGKDKPLSISSGGGFVAFNEFYEELVTLKKNSFNKSGTIIKFDELHRALNNFNIKKKTWIKYSTKLKNTLKEKKFYVLNPKPSINVLVKFENSLEKENLIKICSELNLEFVICPMYIRSNTQALSIEIKRKKILEE